MSTQYSHSRQARALVLAACLGTTATAVFAVLPVLAPYPAPGGNSASYVGEPIAAGGRLWSLGDFDPTAYEKLYYGIGDYTPAFPDFVPGVPKLTMDGTSDALAFDASISDLANGVAGWSGSTQVVLYAGAPTVYTRFVLVVTDPAGNPLALNEPSALGMPAALGGVLDVGGAYRARWAFEASWSAGSGYTAAAPFFDGISGKVPGYRLESSVGGAFYSVPIPEPASYALMLAGLAVLGLRRKLARPSP